MCLWDDHFTSTIVFNKNRSLSLNPTHLLNNYVLNIYCMTDTIPGSWNIWMNKISKNSVETLLHGSLHSYVSLWGHQERTDMPSLYLCQFSVFIASSLEEWGNVNETSLVQWKPSVCIVSIWLFHIALAEFWGTKNTNKHLFMTLDMPWIIK